MKYSVNLVQRGISSQSHPVSGKSGRLYGNAVASPQDGGVLFQMSMEQYLESAHDIVGNTSPSQQWVPIFVPEPVVAGAQGKCCVPAGCLKSVEYIWDRHLFCAEHAPANATHIVTGEAKGVVPSPTVLPEPAPARIEDAPRVVEKSGDLPPETMPPPAVGSEEVVTETSHSDLPKAFLRPADKPAEVFSDPSAPKGPSGAVGPGPCPAGLPGEPGPAGIPEVPPPWLSDAATESDAPPEKAPNGASKKSAAEAIREIVASALSEALAPIAQRLATIEAKTARNGQKKSKEPSAYRQLQSEAKKLGINAFQKSREQLTAEIKAKKIDLASTS